MTTPEPEPGTLPVATRAWTIRPPRKVSLKKPRGRRRRKWSGKRRLLPPFPHAIVVDTETTIDAAQGLLFAAFRYCRIDWEPAPRVTTLTEGLIYADDLAKRDPDGLVLLRRYAATHRADVDMTYPHAEPCWELGLCSRAEFADKWLHPVGYKSHRGEEPALIVMFNAPFDWSRLAAGATKAVLDMEGGFSLVVWTDEDGKPTGWRPRVAIKTIDSKRSLKKFRHIDGEKDADKFAGHLLDLRTLVFALSGNSHSLDSAAASYDVKRKTSTGDLGAITDDSVDYCRNDVAVTTELLEAALADFALHPIDLQATIAYSPASIAKAYLTAMGITPRLKAQPDVSPQLLGLAMAAFYGGRAEVHIRQTPLPVVLVDFTSMYPTVDQLLDLWPVVTAEQVDAVDVTDDVNQLLTDITLDDCFNSARWKDWVVICELVPDGQVLPARAAYGPSAGELDPQGRPVVTGWSIGVNPLTSEELFAYPLCDLIAAKLHTGQAPTVTYAVRFVPAGGRQKTLLPVSLRNRIGIDPSSEDFFGRVVEALQHLKAQAKAHPNAATDEDRRLIAFLKVLANSGSYGIFAEMTRRELPKRRGEHVTVVTGDTDFTAKTSAPEEPGQFCFPPIAACITGAARLMLTLLERSVEDAGGSWMFCDTDSMAIVATESGGLIACEGGPHRLPAGRPAVKALSYADVETIRRRFQTLNPYQPGTVTDLLKREMDGICVAISAKRYAIWDTSDPLEIGWLAPVKISQHGLGRYLDPVSPTTDRRDSKGQLTWIIDIWRWIASALNDPEQPLPHWAGHPAVSRITVSSATLWEPFRIWNAGRPWSEQIKPYNFLLVADVDPFGYPPGVDPGRFRLIAAYDNNPDHWADREWRNLYDPHGRTYRITTSRLEAADDPELVLAKSYGQVIRDYLLHPEHKFAAPDGTPCRRGTRGLLRRRPVVAGEVRRIGKEANKLEDVQAGLIAQLGDVVNDYPDPQHSHFHNHVLPVLDSYSGRQLAELLGTDRRTVDRIRAGGAPRTKLLTRMVGLAAQSPQADPDETSTQ
jgi:hypothetical protein